MKSDQKKEIILAATSSLLCILVTMLMSYPTSVFPIYIHGAICLGIIGGLLETSLHTQTKLTTLLGSSFLVLALSSAFFFSKLIYIQNELQTADKLARSGFKKKALITYAAVGTQMPENGYALFLFSKTLYDVCKYDSAAQTISKAKRYFSASELYVLSGKINTKLNRFKDAEKDFKFAIHMTPNRMLGRLCLFNLYIAQKDTANSILWENALLNMKVKVPSIQTNLMLKETELKLYNYLPSQYQKPM